MTQFNPAGPSRPSSAPARLAMLLCMAWLLMGALFKLLKGNPTDLPPTILEVSPLDSYNTFRSAIAIELCIVAIAFIWPRLGWMFLTSIYIVFLGLLGKLVAVGAESCGCMGGSIKIAPWVMMTIDGTLLLLLLLSKPWKSLPKTTKPVLRALTLLPIFAVAIVMPWVKFHKVEMPPRVAENNSEAPVETEQSLDGFYAFETSNWEGQMIFDLDLALYTDPKGAMETLPAPLHVVLYRKSCEHCRDHIAELAASWPSDQAIALVRIPEVNDATTPDVIEAKPDGHIPIELLKLTRGYGITTPSSFDVDEGFMVSNFQIVPGE